MRLLLLLVSVILLAGPAQAAELQRFSPEGKTQVVDQVVARFSEPLAAMGDLDAAAPFDIDCRHPGRGQWLGPATWTFEFERALPPGARCTFRPRPGLRALSGKAVTARPAYVVETAGVAAQLVNGGGELDERHVFVIGFNAPVKASAALAALRCQVGDGAPAPLQPVPAAEAGGLSRLHLQEFAQDWRQRHGDTPPAYLLARCSVPLTAGQTGAVLVPDTLASVDGVRAERAQRLEFRTAAPFGFSVHCATAVEGHCHPGESVILHWNRILKQADVYAPRLELPDGTLLAPHPESGVGATRFDPPFPQLASLRLRLPAGWSDTDGHALAAAPDALVLRTHAQVVDWEVPDAVAVVPAGAKPILPLAVPDHLHRQRHRARLLRIDTLPDSQVRAWLDRLSAETARSADAREALLAGEAAQETELAAASPDPGHRSTLALPGKGLYLVEWPGGQPARSWVQSAVLVTDLLLHVRQGRESAVAWVTSLSSGKPVAGARVTVLAPGRPLWTGQTGADGLARIPFGAAGQRLFVAARTGDDMAFAPAPLHLLKHSIDGGYLLPQERPDVISTVFDSTLIQPGATLHMKHLRRIGTGAGLVLPPDEPFEVVIAHGSSERKYAAQLHWRAGQAAQDWQAPPDAPLGDYAVTIGAAQAGRFRLEAAAPAASHATLVAPRRILAQQRATATLGVSDLNGHPGHGAASMRVRVERSGGISFVRHPGLWFGSGLPAQPDEAATESPGAQLRARLDREGKARFTLAPLAPAPHVRKLLAEADFDDGNGATRSVAQSIEVAPAAELLAIGLGPRPRGAVEQRVDATVVDLNGKPLAGRRVELSAIRQKGQGEFAEGPLCAALTDVKGKVRCTLALERDVPFAQYTVVARLRTSDGKLSAAHRVSTIDWVRHADDEPGLALRAPSGPLAPGSMLRLGVSGGFSAGWMLVTIEREGILDAQVRRLDRPLKQLDLRLLAAHAPNVTVNMVQVAGRAAAGKEFWANASVAVNVRPDAQALAVTVRADRGAYRPGQRAEVTVVVQPKAGQAALPPGAEVALAVIDAGLLELWPNDSWDLLAAMMRPRTPPFAASGNHNIAQADVQSTQVLVTGHRVHAPPAPFIPPVGLEVGPQPLRARFSPQVLWRATVPLDADGRARIPVTLGDALTRYHIVAVAHAGADRFGHGSLEVATRQALELRPQLAPLARAGDRVQARFVLRNASARTLDSVTRVTLRDSAGATRELPARSVRLAPGQVRELAWDVAVPANAQSSIVWTAVSQAGGESDRLQVEQRVLPAERPRTLQAALVQLDQPRQLTLRLPDGAEGGRLSVGLAATLDGGLAGVGRFFEQYPYTCLEQRLSRSVALADVDGWRTQMRDLERHADPAGLLRYFPGDGERGSDALTVQVLQLARHSGFAVPKETEQRLLKGLAQYLRAPSLAGSTADAGLRRLAALALLAERGVADAASLDAIDPLLDEWPVAALVDWMTALRHSAHPQRERLVAAASAQLRARLYTQGTALALSGEARELRPWTMGHADVSMARLLLAVRDLPEWQAELPLLARGLMQRQRDGHWHTTLANAWGALAMRAFAARSGAAAVDGVSELAVGAERRSLAWPRSGSETVALPAGEQQLSLRHQGTGAPWATLQLTAIVPLAQERFTGIRIRKTVTPLEQLAAGRWSRGDVARVRLELEARADLNWVVVDDPIPPGATVLGGGLQGDSALLAAQGRTDGPVPAWQERAPDALRSYYPAVQRGRWTLEYVLRLNGAGSFVLPATHAEAMYQPEVSGDLPNAAWVVGP